MVSDTTSKYAGTLTVEDGKLQLPDKYAEASQYVIRHVAVTQQYQSGFDNVGWAIWHNLDERPEHPQNPDLALDEATLKLFGEDPELYRVEYTPADEGGDDA